MAVSPSASAAHIYRGYVGDGPRPVYVVTWGHPWQEAALADRRQFSTLDAALKFMRTILSTTVAEWDRGAVT